MSSLSAHQWRVPVIDVTAKNFSSVWPSISLAIRDATFVAIDLELSGLGNRKLLNARSLDDRYRAISETARTRSVLAIGLSCFKVTNPAGPNLGSDDPSRSLPFLVQTYNVTTLCMEPYTVDPASLVFLVDHGFDFNRQYSKGVPYCPCAGNSKDQKSKFKCPPVQLIINELLRQKVPIVVHNGLVDLIFLYRHFYTDLPDSHASLMCDLTEMFGGGIYDTKYLAEFIERSKASFLEYIFKKSQRDTLQAQATRAIRVTLHYLTLTQVDCVVYKDCTPRLDGTKKTCQNFMNHGWCAQRGTCPYSHDVDDVLNRNVGCESKQKRKRRRKRRVTTDNQQTEAKVTKSSVESVPISDNTRENSGGTAETGIVQEDHSTDSEDEKNSTVSTEPISMESHSMEAVALTSTNGCMVPEGDVTAVEEPQTGCHRAGFDAFMTGYTMAVYMTKHGKVPTEAIHQREMIHYELDHVVNKLNLSGKDIPLSVTKSGFSKTSKGHRDRWASLQGAATETNKSKPV